MQFEKVIGQKEVKEHLKQMVQQNRLSHALLFLGKEGYGALPLAIAFAQYIVCRNTSPNPSKGGADNGTASLFFDDTSDVENETAASLSSPVGGWGADSCGTCPACIKAQKLMHPDIHFSFPVITKKAGEKPLSADYINEFREFISLNPYGNVYDWLQFINAENKQGNISAAECNEIIKTLNLKSFESEYKILIMWMPEFLGKEGNKLLKLIEEPPANTLFILVAENEDAILPTILSRTQLIKIPCLSNLEVEAALELRAGAKMETAQQIAALAEGNYREATQLLQHTESDWLQLLREWLNITLKQDFPAQLKWIDEISKQGRENQKQFLKYFIHLLELSIRENELGAVSHSSETELEFASKLNNFCSIYQKEAIIDELNKASYYIERNANGKILFHALSIKLYHIIKNNSLILVN